MIIGRITAIEYGKIKVRISEKMRGSSVNLRGEIYYFGNIGGYLKIPNARNETIVCEVTSIMDSDPQGENQSFDIEGNRELLLKPIGTITNDNQDFSLGIGIYPTLYSSVEILTIEDMNIIMNNNKMNSPYTEEEKTKHRTLLLGESKNLINYPLHVEINQFFNIHSAVLGNSGSGKSNSIAHILQNIFEKTSYAARGAKVVLFDVNGEYKEALKSLTNEDEANKISVTEYVPNSTDKTVSFYMPHFLMNLDEWCGFLLATEATQRPFWNRVLQETIRFYSMSITPEKEGNQRSLIHYFLYRVCTMIENVLSQVDSDTSTMTKARSLIGKIKDIIKTTPQLQTISSKKYNAENMSNPITGYYMRMEGTNPKEREKEIKCNISDVLEFLFDLAPEVQYGANHSCLQKTINSIRDSLDDALIDSVLDKKYEIGSWYEPKFLKIAAEMCLLEEDAHGNKNIRNWTSTLMTRLDYFLDNSECTFMRDNKKNSPGVYSKNKYLEEYFSIPKNFNELESQIIILNVSELSPDVLETLTSVIARLLFDHSREDKKRNEEPIHLILDEAHRYVQKNKNYMLKENIFEKIAREGRKYSCYLLISSQRPSELSETVLSQCGNYIVHRIQNDQDMNYIKAIMPFFSQDFVDKIKQSVPGEAVVFGNCVPMPLQVAINKASPAPDSDNCDISEEWFI